MTQWYDGRPVRDRAVLLIGAVFVIVFLIFYLLINPWGRKNDRVIQQISTLKTEMADLQAKEQVISARKDFDPDSKNLKLLGVLLEESAKLEQQLQEGIVNLVTPREMPQVLKELLTQQDDLQLISLENLVPQQLKFDRKEIPDEFSPILYRHSLGMTFSGNYLTLLKYLKQLEQLPRTLIWEEVEILSENYPQATVRLQVYTLSLKEGWIGG
jgi:MSHA biogenesis protein MshJ